MMDPRDPGVERTREIRRRDDGSCYTCADRPATVWVCSRSSWGDFIVKHLCQQCQLKHTTRKGWHPMTEAEVVALQVMES